MAPTSYSQRGRCCDLYMGSALMTCLETCWPRTPGSPKRVPPHAPPVCGQGALSQVEGTNSIVSPEQRRSVSRWVGRLESGAGEELAAAWLASDVAVFDDHVAAGDDGDWPSGDLVTVVWLEI